MSVCWIGLDPVCSFVADLKSKMTAIRPYEMFFSLKEITKLIESKLYMNNQLVVMETDCVLVAIQKSKMGLIANII